jgi:outer membrane protein TolC
LQAALQRLSLADVEVANAQELLRISEGRYEGGLGLFLDITNAENSFVSAKRNLSQADADVQRARARLAASIGKI